MTTPPLKTWRLDTLNTSSYNDNLKYFLPYIMRRLWITVFSVKL